MRHLRLVAATAAVMLVVPLLLVPPAASKQPTPFTLLPPSSFTALGISPSQPIASQSPEATIATNPVATPPSEYLRPAVRQIQPVAKAEMKVKPKLVVKPKPRPRPILKPKQAPRPPALRVSGSRISGQATYYCWPGHGSICMAIHSNGGMYAAAGPALRAAICGSSTSNCWRGKRIMVRGPAGSAVVTLADWCRCTGGHLIDLYHDVLVKVTTNPWGAWVKLSW